MLFFRRLRKGHFGAVGLGMAAAALAAGQGVVRVREARADAQISVNRPREVRADGFESSQACRACHPSQYASWHASYHRTMTQIATPETVAPSFDNVRVAEAPGEPMQLEVRGRELWADFHDSDSDGVRGVRHLSERIQRRVVLTTGSHHQQIFWYATGNSRILGQLPAIWLTAERRWIPRRAAVMRPPGPPQSETGAWNGICVACHTTDGRPQFDTPFGSQPIASQTANTSSAEFGIACEACHGPSADHVAANASVRRRYSLHVTQGADATITRPDRLDAKRSSQVCGQCHSFWEFRDVASERRANTEGLGFRPGHDLAASRFIVSPTSNAEPETMKALLAADPGFVRDTFWSDGMVRATGREYNALLESPCYKNARDNARTLSCYSCHTMHKTPDDPRSLVDWVDDQLSAAAQGNGACVTCHAMDVSAHTHHRADSPGGSCYNCHMPYTTYGLLKTVRSHQISNPSAQATLDTGRPNACNLCHLDKTLAWTADALNRWYGTPRPSMADDEASIAASLVTLLKGDAGQRAIVAQSMGWADAQRASRTAWMAPYLALLLDDPYDAVRYIASRSLKRLPGFERFEFDFVAPPQTRAAGRVRALQTWRDSRPSVARETDPALLFLPNGTFNAPAIDRLRRERDNRRVVYRE
jgi:Cytochrome c554 and c-prime